MAVRVTVTRQLLRRGTPHREKHPDHGGQLSHGGDIRLDLIPQARVLHLDGTDLVQQAQGLEVGLQAYGPSRGVSGGKVAVSTSAARIVSGTSYLSPGHRVRPPYGLAPG